MQNNSLGKNALLNGIKQMCSIVFPFLSFTYCSRILGADVLGIYSFGQSVIAYLLLIATLGIPNYAIREGAALRNNEEKLKNFINEVFSISCITTIFAYFLLIILLFTVAQLDEYKTVILILSMQILLTTLGTDWINSIYEDYFYLTIRYIAIQIIAIICLILFVQSPSDIYIYTLISMLANVGGNIFNLGYIRRKKNIKIKFKLHMNFKIHIIPIFILFCNSVAVVLYLNSDITMLGIFMNETSVGIYTVSSKIYTMVKTLINAIIMVTVPRFSFYLANNKFSEYKQNLSDTFNILILLICPSVVGMFLEADKILLLVAGKEYITGVSVVKILSFALFFAVGACFFSYSILMPNHKEKKFLFSTVTAAVVNVVLNLLFIPLLGIRGAAFTTLLAEIVVFILSVYYSIKTIKFSVDLKELCSVLLASGFVAIVCVSLDRIIHNVIIGLILDIILSAIVYILILIVLKNKVMLNIINLIKKKYGGKFS